MRTLKNIQMSSLSFLKLIFDFYFALLFFLPPSLLQIDEWLEYAPIFASGSQFEEACGYVDGYLLQHTFLVGHSLSIADIAVWSGLAGS